MWKEELILPENLIWVPRLKDLAIEQYKVLLS